MQHLKIFVVEDDRWYAEYIKHVFSLLDIRDITIFSSGKELEANLGVEPDVITLDFNLPDIKGDKLIDTIKKRSPKCEILIVSGQEDIQTALELIKKGAFDYLVKNDDLKNRLISVIHNVERKIRMQTRISELEDIVSLRSSPKKMLLSSDKSMDKIYDLIEKAGNNSINVSIYGESGTGKELVAKAIHESSKTSKAPFVAVNLSAIPENLMESELFGHIKGSFTGAISDRQGKFQEAGTGTLFLDEIGEISPQIQVKLLRVLQEREITPVGSNKVIPIKCKIITATNKDLKEEVLNGKFREDLYYRLIGLPIALPALRERGNDTLLLATHFLKEFGNQNKIKAVKFDEMAKEKLSKYPFPGNVRELRSVIELAGIIAESECIEAKDIIFQSVQPVQNFLNGNQTLKEINERIIDDLLTKNNNDVRKVASILDIGKSTIYRMLKERQT